MEICLYKNLNTNLKNLKLLTKARFTTPFYSAVKVLLFALHFKNEDVAK